MTREPEPEAESVGEAHSRVRAGPVRLPQRSTPDGADTQVQSFERRLEDVVDTIGEFAELRFDARAPVGPDGDVVDAVAAGVNFLAEELEASFSEIERRVADRTAELSIATQELGARTRLFAALAEFAAALNSIREPGRLAAALIDAVNAVVPSDTVVITVLDRSDGLYRVSAVRGLDQDAVGAIIQPGDGSVGRAISERALVLTERHPRVESTAALRDYLQHEALRSAAVPLINEGIVLGAISVGRADRDATFTHSEREVFALLGSHAALALANAYLVEEVSALAIHDGLTGLYNRRHFDAALDLAIARFKRHAPAGSLAAIMFDLDHFGDFNNRHGHLAGDTLLRLFGKILRRRLRSADVVARYGGEEFVAILDDCGLSEAVRLAEEVRRELEARSVPGADGRPAHATVSAGCAVLSPQEPTKEALIGRADAGLFMAKRAGRNQVVAA